MTRASNRGSAYPRKWFTAGRPAFKHRDGARTRLRFELLEPRMMLAGPTAAGGEFQVNSYTTERQDAERVAADSAGDFVVVWESVDQDGSGLGIYARRFNSSGAAQGSDILVNTYTTGDQALPAVAMDSAGDFVVAWEGNNEAGDGSGAGIFAQRFDSGAKQGSEFLVNSYTTGNQITPSVAMDSAGDFVITWTSDSHTGSSVNDIYAQRYNSSGAAQGGEFLVNTYTTGLQENPSVAMDSAGDFAVDWQSYGEDGSNYGVYAQRYNSSGAVQGSEFRVNTYTTGVQFTEFGQTIAMDSAGDFVIAWTSYSPDGNGGGIFAQRYNASGAAQGSEFQVNTYTFGIQHFPSVAMDSAGDFAITWESYNQDGSSYGVYAQSFDSSGAKQGSEFQVNTYTGSGQHAATAAMDSAGDLVVAWTSDGQDAGTDGIYAQRYTAPPSTVLTINGTSSSNNVTVTFTDATHFQVKINDGSPTSYTTSSVTKLVYNGPAGTFSKFVFVDAFNTYSATQSFSSTDLTSAGFELDANSIVNLYIYSNSGTSTATVNVASGTESNFYVADASLGYSYIGDPALGTFSELSGFIQEAVTGSGGTTYAYVYSTSNAQLVGNPSGNSTLTLGSHTSTLADFSQLYAVGAEDGTDHVTLDSDGGSFVGTPNFSYVSGSGFLIGALYAASVTAQSAGSNDTAAFYSYAANTFNGQVGTDSLTGSTTGDRGQTVSFSVQALGYLSTTVYESGAGTDVANLTSSGHATFTSTTTVSTMSLGSSSFAINTFFVNGSNQIVAVPSQIVVNGAHDGTDTANLYDGPGSNTLVVGGSTATLTRSGSTVTVNRFGAVSAYQQNGSSDTVHQASAIDFALATVGSWTTV